MNVSFFPNYIAMDLRRAASTGRAASRISTRANRNASLCKNRQSIGQSNATTSSKSIAKVFSEATCGWFTSENILKLKFFSEFNSYLHFIFKVPGRIPRNARAYNSSRKNRMAKHMVRPTTFFPSNYVPVSITNDDDNNLNSLDPNYYRNGCNANSMNDRDVDNMIIVDEPSDTEADFGTNDDEKISALIKRVKRDKEREYTIETSISEHNGYKVMHLLLCEINFNSIIHFF